MGDDIIKEQFVNFSKEMKKLAFLTAIGAISIVGTIVSMFGGMYYYGGYGTNSIAVIISIIINLVVNAITVISYYFLFRSAMNIKKINETTSNISLRSFHSNILIGIICNFIGIIGISISSVIQLILSTSVSFGGNYWEDPLYQSLSGVMFYTNWLLIGSGIGIILFIVSWKNMEEFFRGNANIFPENIGIDATMAAKKMKGGYLFSAFRFLSIMMPSPFSLLEIIGILFLIVGFYNLHRSLGKLDSSRFELKGKLHDMYSQSSFQQPQIQQLKTKEGNFCGKCGTPMAGDELFCTTCGVAKS